MLYWSTRDRRRPDIIWAYIYDTRRQEWLKFNDITVSGASWEDLMKESVGGYHNASAYCLMYVDKSHYDDQGKLYHNASAYCLMYVDKSHYDDQGKLYHNASAYCLMYVDKSHYDDQGKLQSSPFIMPPFVPILSIFISKESVGGYHNASAYCLMYVDKSHYEDQGKLQSSPFIMPPFVRYKGKRGRISQHLRLLSDVCGQVRRKC